MKDRAELQANRGIQVVPGIGAEVGPVRGRELRLELGLPGLGGLVGVPLGGTHQGAGGFLRTVGGVDQLQMEGRRRARVLETVRGHLDGALGEQGRGHGEGSSEKWPRGTRGEKPRIGTTSGNRKGEEDMDHEAEGTRKVRGGLRQAEVPDDAGPAERALLEAGNAAVLRWQSVLPKHEEARSALQGARILSRVQAKVCARLQPASSAANEAHQVLLRCWEDEEVRRRNMEEWHERLRAEELFVEVVCEELGTLGFADAAARFEEIG